MQRYQWVWGALVALGCSGRAIDVGPGGTLLSGADGATPGGVSAGGGAPGGGSGLLTGDCIDPAPLTPWPDSSACVASSNLPWVGTWTGYVENQSAPWDQLTLVITGASSAAICGTLTIGAGPAPPPATDASVGYPPDSLYGPGLYREPYLLAYPLTFVDTTIEGSRARFVIGKSEPFRSWCKLEGSWRASLTQGSGCGCLAGFSPSSTFIPPDGRFSICTISNEDHSEMFTVDCVKRDLCLGGGPVPGLSYPVCECNAAGCDATPGGPAVQFDLLFAPDGATATGSNTFNPQYPTHFARVK